jgi:hypothetical protein
VPYERCSIEEQSIEYCGCVFVGLSSIFLLGILIFKRLTARRLYKSFGVKGLMTHHSLLRNFNTHCTKMPRKASRYSMQVLSKGDSITVRAALGT